MTQTSARRRRALVGLLATVAAAASIVVLAPASPAGAAPPPLPAPNSNGITLTGWVQVTAGEPTTVARLLDATVTTGSIFRPGVSPSINPTTIPVKVRILLPADYTTDPSHPYPVLYLLHGGAGQWSDWSGSDGDVKNIVAGSPFDGIVVMPEGGRAGWYSNWRGQTDGRFSPQWEDFHVRQLVPWIDANFNTIADRSGRGIAGVSMGGLGTLMYSARFTGTFSRVGSLSAGTDLTEPGAQQIVADSLWQAGASIGNTGLLDGNYRVTGSTLDRLRTVFGPEGANGRWDTQNPYQMAGNYNAYDTRFGLYSGQNALPWEGEGNIGRWNTRFHQALNANGVVHRYCTGTGSHAWSYWRQDLADFLDYAYGTTPSSCPNGWGAPAA